MNNYRIRFNKTRGNPGRGTVDHVWRVFENEREYLCKHLHITAPLTDAKDPNGTDYNLVCQGFMRIDRDTSTIYISSAEAV